MLRQGQALLVVLLMLGVALTIGVSIASRSTTEVEISATQQEAARALEAAEAGLEKALGGLIVTDTLSEPVAPGAQESFSVSFSQATNTNMARFSGIRAGDNATVNLEYPEPTGPIQANAKARVCWGYQPSPGFQPALVASVYSRVQSTGKFRVKRWAFDPISSRAAVNRFTAASGAVNCPSVFEDGSGVFSYSAVLDEIRDPPGGERPLYLQLRLLYNGDNPQYVAVNTACGGCGSGWGWFIPRQGDEIISVGQAGSTTKKLKVTQSFFDPWPIFSDAIFSGSGDVGH